MPKPTSMTPNRGNHVGAQPKLTDVAPDVTDAAAGGQTHPIGSVPETPSAQVDANFSPSAPSPPSHPS